MKFSGQKTEGNQDNGHRILADDNSIHEFPDGTSGDVIARALGRYHEDLLSNSNASRSTTECVTPPLQRPTNSSLLSPVERRPEVAVIRPWTPWSPRTWVRIRLDGEEGPHFDLQMLQERMCKAVDDYPQGWDDFEDPRETKAWFWSAIDIPSLIGQIIALDS